MSRSMSRSRAKSRSASFGMGGLALGLLGYAAYYALNTTPPAEPLLEIGQGTKPPAPAPMVKTSAISNVKTSATVQKSTSASGIPDAVLSAESSGERPRRHAIELIS